MFADAEHEVIDSPAALFRHLYEEHGVEEARDLDPESAPLQFWLRRHADLERAERSGRVANRQPGPPPEPARPPEARRTRADAPARAEPPGRAEARREPAAPFPPAGGRGQARPEPSGGRDGRRHAGFGDPLVEGLARALAGRGHEEAAVRSAIRSFADGRGPSGEAAVRAAFVEPMVQAAAERLLGAPRAARGPEVPGPAPADPARPAPARAEPDPAPGPPPRREEPARPEPARPEAAWAVLWADLADSVRRPGEGAAAGDDGDDLMAVANAVQARRRVRVLRR
jgi:hypothetical protein